MTDHPEAKPEGLLRRSWPWLRWVGVAIVLTIIGVEIYLILPSLEKAWHNLDRMRWDWVLLCIVAAGLSMDSYGQVQRALLRSAGVKVTQWRSVAVILAGNSMSQTLPAGAVMSPAFTYRQTRKWGASPVVASWQVVMSGLLAAAGLAVLGLTGAVLAGAKTSPFSILFSVCGFLAFLAVAQYLATHPEVLESLGARFLKWLNGIRDKDPQHGLARLHEIIDQTRAVKLKPKDMSIAFGWSLFNWVADVACLACACYAVGGKPSISGLMVAYAAGKAVATAIPLLPGGLGIMDGVLVPALASAGMTTAQAITGVLVYRLVSYVLVALVGWVVIAVMFRRAFSDATDIDEDEALLERAAEQAREQTAHQQSVAPQPDSDRTGNANPRRDAAPAAGDTGTDPSVKPDAQGS